MNREASALGPGREYGPFAVALLLVLALCLPRHAAINLVWAAPLMIWIVVVAVRSPARRHAQARKAAMLAIAFAVVAVVHLTYAHVARTEAQEVVDAVLRFKTREGRFPERVADMGLGEPELRRDHIYFHKPEASEPSLIYLATFVPFSTYRFDFGSGEWVFQPD